MSYSTKALADFTNKHPKNYTQLMHMSMSNYLSQVNHNVATSNVTNQALQGASNDVGLTVDNYLRKNKKGIMLPNAYISSFNALATGEEATYGNYVSALLYQHALYVKSLNDAVNASQGYSNILQGMSDNGNMMMNLLQSAGNNPMMVDKSVKMWKKYINDTVRHVQTKNHANVVQLHSFNIANHMMQLLA